MNNSCFCTFVYKQKAEKGRDIMKRHLKWGIILICTILFLGITGCGKEEESMKEALERVRNEEEAKDALAGTETESGSAKDALTGTETEISGAEDENPLLDQAIQDAETEEAVRRSEEQAREFDRMQDAYELTRAMAEEQEAENEESESSSSVSDENICPDCGYERLEVQCALCSGTGMTKYCERCEGTGIICRNCFYPPSEPPASEDSSGTSSGGKGQRMCGRCNGDGYAGTCFSCNGNGYTSHSEFYDSYGTGGSTYEVTRPCYLCKNGERKCTLCKGTGWVDK